MIKTRQGEQRYYKTLLSNAKISLCILLYFIVYKLISLDLYLEILNNLARARL